MSNSLHTEWYYNNNTQHSGTVRNWKYILCMPLKKVYPETQ